jgi:hypothetical protein
MNIVLVTSLVVIGVVIVGGLIAFLFFQLSNLVRKEQFAMEMDRNRYNQALTVGHQITVDADVEKQLEEAKIIAAKKAASLPRGGNVRIGSYGTGAQPTASDGLDSDPVSAVKIAQYHTWQGLAPGASTAAPSVKPTLAPTQTAPSLKSAGHLVPGKDFPVIEITDDMAPAEIRKARIANAKAKSAAIKAQKTTESAAPVQATQQTEVVTAAPAAPEAAAAPASAVSAPVAGVDYEVIEITDDMDPADIRKARIANAKAKSAAMKAFKAAGGQAQAAAPATATVEIVEPQPPTTETVQDAANPSRRLPKLCKMQPRFHPTFPHRSIWKYQMI